MRNTTKVVLAFILGLVMAESWEESDADVTVLAFVIEEDRTSQNQSGVNAVLSQLVWPLIEPTGLYAVR